MTWLERQVRLTGWRQVGLAGFILAATIGLLAYNLRFLTNYFAGPRTISRAELLEVKDVEEMERYWVTMQADRVLDSGIDIVSVKKKRGFETGRSVTGHYYVGVVGEKLLVIKANGNGYVRARPDATTVEGALVPASDEIIAMMTSTPQSKPLRERFMPMQLEAGGFKSDGELLMGLAYVASGLAGLIALFGLYRVLAPGRHRALRSLSTTPGQSLAEASSTLEAEVAHKQFIALGGGAKLTASHLLQPGALRFNVRPLDDLLWAYPVVTTKKLYGVITTGRSHSAMFNFKRGKPVKVTGAEPAIQSAMNVLARVHPWVLLGHEKKLAADYRRKRKDVIAAVDSRRAQVMAQVAAAQQPQHSGQLPPATGA
jgi:hypothetical protein